MVEWWVSQKKHWCDICKVWHGGHIQQILKHRGGRMHQEREEAMLKSAREREKDRKQAEKDMLKEIRQIERAAEAAMAAYKAAQPALAPPGGPVQLAQPGEPGQPAQQPPQPPPAAQPAQLASPAGQPAAAGQDLASRQAEQKREIEMTVEAAKRRRMEGAPGASGLAPSSGRRDGVQSANVASPSAPSSAQAAPAVGAGTGGTWTAHVDPGSGQTYHYNPTTQESRWQPPPELASAPAPAAAAPVPATAPLAASSSWVVVTDPGSGHVYYYNMTSGTSTWERPPDLGVDLSKPPPPPSTRRPPPPPARREEAAVGKWEEVRPEESVFSSFGQSKSVDSSDEEAINPIKEMKGELLERRGPLVQEDLQVHEKEVHFEKKSISGSSEKQVSFPMARKRAAGVRKRTCGEGD